MLRKRPLWSRALRIPGTWFGHYRLLRESGTPRFEAAIAAASLAVLLIK